MTTATHPDLAPYVSLILGSVVVRALGPSLITLFGQWRERRARRQELILSEAVKLGQAETERRLRIAAADNKPLTLIRPLIQTTGHCYKSLNRLMETRKLDPVRVLFRKPEDL